MSTRLEIWNGAFSRLTGGSLDSADLEDDGTPLDPNAIIIANVYPSLIAAALSREAWPWTLRRTTLMREAAPDHPEMYRYALPADRLGSGVREVYTGPEAQRPLLDGWRIEGAHLYTNEPRLQVLYTQFAQGSEATWPEQFALWVRTLLCAECAVPHGQSETRAQSYADQAEMIFEQLTGTTGQEQAPKQLFSSFATTSSRYGAGYEHRPIAFAPDGSAT